MQLNCTKVLQKCPTSETLGAEEKTWPYASLPLYWHYLARHRSPRKSSETTSGWFLKVRSCFLVCSGIITLHCIVWAAILFPGHPYIESATTLY